MSEEEIKIKELITKEYNILMKQYIIYFYHKHY